MWLVFTEYWNISDFIKNYLEFHLHNNSFIVKHYWEAFDNEDLYFKIQVLERVSSH